MRCRQLTHEETFVVAFQQDLRSENWQSMCDSLSHLLAIINTKLLWVSNFRTYGFGNWLEGGYAPHDNQVASIAALRDRRV
jgi:hypothetical protein